MATDSLTRCCDAADLKVKKMVIRMKMTIPDVDLASATVVDALLEKVKEIYTLIIYRDAGLITLLSFFLSSCCFHSVAGQCGASERV